MEYVEKQNDPIVRVKFDKRTCILFYISRIMNIDFATLHSIYKDVGVNLFKLFFMFAGRKIAFPKEDRLLGFLAEADEVYSKLTNNPDNKLSRIKTNEIYNELINSLNNDTMEISIHN